MGVILGILGMIALSLFVRWLGVEIGVHHNPVCHWLVRFAAARLPPRSAPPPKVSGSR